MTPKRTIAVIVGGRSAEHEISLRSGRNVVEAINPEAFDVIVLGIDRSGTWHRLDREQFLSLPPGDPLGVATSSNERNVVVRREAERTSLLSSEGRSLCSQIDVVFPVLHGPYGEDGTIQGFLKLADIPFVGPSVLGSAAAMDKDVTKRLLRDAGIPIAKFECFRAEEEEQALKFERIKKSLGLPLFVKPANLGSSVGITKVNSEQDYSASIRKAFEYDRKIILEEFIAGREIECSVLGNAEPIASIPGEIVTTESHDFYSYEAKYLDESGAELLIPAPLDSEVASTVQALAITTFKALCLEGMARVDFFLKQDGSLVVNEVNTIPGFTSISMYPKLFEASGIPYSKLIERLVDLALKRHSAEKALKNA